MNPCPHCGEPVLEMAANCRHCGQMLDDKTFCLGEGELVEEIRKAKEELARKKAAREAERHRLSLMAYSVGGIGVVMMATFAALGPSRPALAGVVLGAVLLGSGLYWARSISKSKA